MMKAGVIGGMKGIVTRVTLILFALYVGIVSSVYADNFGTPTTGGTEVATEVQDNSQCTSKNPIYYFSGRETHVVTDIEVKGLIPIVLKRKYDSRATYDSPLGYGWAFDYDRRLYEYSDGSIIMRTGCGRRTKFVKSAGAWITPASKIHGQLTELGASRYVFRYQNGEQNFFDAAGRLEAIQDPQGNRLEFQYDDRGRLPLTGTSPYAVDPTRPMVVARTERLIRIEVRGADNILTGQSLVFSYNETTGRLQTVTANDGRVITYEHDIYDVATGSTTGNLVKVTGLEGVVSTYQYTDPNDSHNLTYFQEGLSNVAVQTQYDNRDRAISQTRGRERITITHNNDLTVDVVTVMDVDDAGQEVTYSESYLFYPDSYISKYTDSAGYQYLYFYAGDLVRRKEMYRPGAVVFPGTGRPVNGEKPIYTWAYQYNASGNRTQETVYENDNDVVTRTWTYDNDWVASEQTISSSAPTEIFRTEYTFYKDANGYPTNIKEKKKRKADGAFQNTTYTYDANGRLETTTLPDSHVITNVYTGAFLTKVYHDDGAGGESPYLKVEYDYDAQGNRNWIKDANGNITTMVYDARGRIIQITNALNEETHYTYTDDKLTQIEVGRTATDGPGQFTQLTYTTEGWLESIARQKDDGSTWLTLLAYTYDKRGKPLSLTEPANILNGSPRTTLFEHDTLGHLTQVTDPAGNVMQYTYDPLGNRRSVIDPNNNRTWYTYDILNRLTQIIQTGITPNPVTKFTYDAVGNLTSVTDAKNQTTTYEYDALSNNTAVVQPLNQRVEYYYDDRNRLDYMINARGQKIDYEYEPWGPVKVVRYYEDESTPTIDRTVSYTFNNNGFLTAAYDSAVQGYILYNIIPDALNRVSMVYQFGFAGGTQYQINAYDRYGNRNGVTTWRDGVQLNAFSYDYNKLNRLTAATLLAPTALNFTYNDNGSIRQITHANGIKSNYIYEINGPVKQIQLNGTGVLGQRDYVYDANRNVDTLTTLIGLHDYSYDGLNRLTEALHPTGSDLPAQERFAYDDVGNREDITDDTLYQYDSNNRITNSPNTTWYLDDDGNTRLRYDGSLAETFIYNHENRLTKYLKGGNTADYIYDPFGRRLKKTVNGVTTWFWWDGDKLLAEYDNSGNLIKRYAYMPGNYAPAQMADSAGNVYTVHSDHLDTPKQMTDSTGQVVWSAEHTAYGESTPNTDVDGDGNHVTLNVRFPGQYYDSETGLFYNYFRYYDPRIGRYITADPIGQYGGINTYLYVNANPLMFTDPLGLRPTKNPKGPDGQPIEHDCVTMCWANAVGSTMLAGAAGMGIGALVGRMGLGVAGATAGGAAIHVGSSANSAYGFFSLAECLEQCEEEEEACK